MKSTATCSKPPTLLQTCFTESRQSPLFGVVRIEILNIEIVHSVPLAQVLEGRTMAQCDREKALAVQRSEVPISTKELLFLGACKMAQGSQFANSYRAIDVRLCHNARPL